MLLENKEIKTIFFEKEFLKILIVDDAEINRLILKKFLFNKKSIIFQPYEQVNITDSLRHGGMGLGYIYQKC